MTLRSACSQEMDIDISWETQVEHTNYRNKGYWQISGMQTNLLLVNWETNYQDWMGFQAHKNNNANDP